VSAAQPLEPPDDPRAAKGEPGAEDPRAAEGPQGVEDPRAAEGEPGAEAPLPDPLAELAARLDAARAAAERLAAEAAAARAAPDDGAAAGPPPSGREATAELQALLGLLDVARSLIPEDLWARLVELARALLLAVRALLDGWIVRLEPHAPDPPRPPAVEDIEIDPS